jgi:hypothetical protein
MKKMALGVATAGFLVAVSSGCAWFYIYSHGLYETGGARIFAKIITYAWPTSLMLMEVGQADFGTVLLFLTSSIANAFIYGIVGLCIYLCLEETLGSAGETSVLLVGEISQDALARVFNLRQSGKNVLPQAGPCPGGTFENSPALPAPGGRARGNKVPEARLKISRPYWTWSRLRFARH